MLRLTKINPINLLWLLLCGLVIICGCDRKTDDTAPEQDFEIEKPYYTEAMRLKVKLSSEQINLSDLLVMELALEIKPGYQVDFPVVSEALKQFKIRTWDQLPSKLLEENKVLKVNRYKLEPLEIGRCQIPALTFEFQQKGSAEAEPETKTLTTEPILIEVTTSLPADMQGPTIADIEDIVDLKPDRTLLWIAIGVVVLLLAGMAIGIALKPKKAIQIKRVYKPAHEIAFEMLRSLAAEKLVEQGMVKEFYEKLSDCLRKYIENRFSLRALEQTTEEFLEQLKRSDALDLEHKTELQKFLEHCDLVKFAKYQPTDEQINESLTMAEQFVDRTKSQAHQVDITEVDSK
jgi:hypothetical protein